MAGAARLSGVRAAAYDCSVARSVRPRGPAWRQERNRLQPPQRRACALAALVLVLLSLSLSAAAAPPPREPVAVLLEGSRRDVPTVMRGDVELFPLEQVTSALGITLKSDGGASATLSFEGRSVTIQDRKNLVSVGGDLRLLSAPATVEAGKVLVPVDSVPKIMGPLLRRRAEWRLGTRTLVLGNVQVARLTLSTSVSGDVARVTIDASSKVTFKVAQEDTRITVSIPEAVDVTFQQERLTGGIVDEVRFLGGRENIVQIATGPRFKEIKAQQTEQPCRLFLEFHAGGEAAAASPAPGEPPSPTPAPTGPVAPVVGPDEGGRIVVIDPGHGGVDFGATGPTGAAEKEVVLAISRRLRTLLVNAGYQVFLTRDHDQDLSLDDRAAVANNYKADVFISIHANASQYPEARGSEVYFLSAQASDAESHRVAQIEGATGAAPPGTGGGELGLILWDMAQVQHLAQSSVLATRIDEQLGEVTSTEGRGVKQAPFRVLVGAAMPAVLVEVAFITNPAEEKLCTSEAFQGRVAAAVLRGVTRFFAGGSPAAGR